MTMDVYYFTECPYPDAWNYIEQGPIRVSTPNRLFDPVKGADLLNQRLDEYVLADELGMNIMLNEHRSTTTCLTASIIPPLAMMARQTSKARILSLGATIGMRQDPVGLAEELAYIDVVSRGRLDMGLVKGYPAEIAPSNMNPSGVNARFWEAHDLILKAMTSHDGPFNWEGEHYHYRQVNIWPRPYQQPHPPVWVTSFSMGSTIEIADHNYVVSAAADAKLCKDLFGAYRHRRAQHGDNHPGLDRFSYLGLLAVGETEEIGLQRLSKVRGWVWSSGVTPPQFANPPGFNPATVSAPMLRRDPTASWATRAVGRSGRTINPSTCPAQDLVDLGMGFGGTPDQVYDQLVDFYHHVGGFGHLLAMMQGGDLSHAETVDSMRLFAKEVMPRLRDLPPPAPEYARDWTRAA
jgi:alkanesulfonate monooxygenase SsuD/methylene tetrahydromethanopterin reductase-like flavin-dependent oxidoreductase (luciferase family)